MARYIKEIFTNCLEDLEDLGNVPIDELKYSKAKRKIIVAIKTELFLDPAQILMFENRVQENFDLVECFVDYKYQGNKITLTKEIITMVINRYVSKNPYSNPIFKNYSITIQDDNKVKINFQNVYSEILKMKKVKEKFELNIKSYYDIDTEFEFIDADIDNSKKYWREDAATLVKSESNADTKKEDAAKYEQSALNVEKINEQNEKVILGKPIFGELTNISNIAIMPKIVIEGVICNKEDRKIRSGKILITLDITDYNNTTTAKMFLAPEKAEEIADKIKVGKAVKISGAAEFDKYSSTVSITIRSMEESSFKKPSRMDNSDEKRVELHMHTQMSAMDAVSSAKSIVNTAIKWGHKAVAITDHGVVQAFPEAHLASKGSDGYKIKVLYGMEGYLLEDLDEEILDEEPTYCVLDIETTGLKKEINRITEIAVAKVKNGVIIDEFSTFVNPKTSIPPEIVEITNITDEMVKDAPTIEEVMPKFIEFIGDSILVAHNSPFDIPFLKYKASTEAAGLDFQNKNLDTLKVAKSIYPEFYSFKLGYIYEKLFGHMPEVQHRAIDDVRTTVEIFNEMTKRVEENGFKIYQYAVDTNEMIRIKSLSKREAAKYEKPYHIILFAKNYEGLKNLYRIISYSNLKHFYKKPRIPKSLLKIYREGLIIGSACEQGELYKAILLDKGQEKIQSIVDFYDYLEIQPLDNNQFMLREPEKFPMIKSKQDLIDINKRIIKLGEDNNKLVVGTCDVHFLNPEDYIYREFIQESQGYSDFDKQPPLYFRTTEEMLKEFDYLSPEKAKEIVIENTNKIADMIEQIQPVPDGTYPPSIENSERDLEDMCYAKAREIYGDDLPEIVEARLKKELNSIITNGFSVMYMIAQKLVAKSNEWGYLVGSRGSVGSSFVATMSGITEVNPLPAHYICSKCKYSEFTGADVTTGVDMPDKNCPHCNTQMKKDGMDIPFETFLGFKGDKVPDIDLNFSGDVQSKIHAYTGELFGEGKTFKAGTIGTVAEKTALAYVVGYYKDLNKTASFPEMRRLSQGVVGIKRTTGQHPGGVIVVPHDKEIYDFCPVQRPAEDPTSKIITTHFDFHSIHDNLLKLDMLGHDDPTIIKMLERLTGIDAKDIPLDEPGVMSLFKGTEALGVTPEQINSKTGTYAVPEFGTKFVRQMLEDTKPTTFGELIRISGLSHGTDVWLGNAQMYIQEGQTTLKDAICCRDDIMIYLIRKGMDPALSFKTMESVRKGKGLKPEMEEAMIAANVPQWYIDSCLKIKYMFPKAHAAAYVMMAYRIAYFKVHYPKEFYATYLTIRAKSFDSEIMLYELQRIKDAMVDIDNNINPSLRYMTAEEQNQLSEKERQVQNKDEALYGVLEVVNEMRERKINFLPVDIYKSLADSFQVEEDGIRPPLSALNAFGEVAAKQLVEAREQGKFDSQQELQSRAKLGKVAMQILIKNNCLDGMPKSDQLDLFEM